MSTDSPSSLRPRFVVTPTMRITLLAWGVVLIGAFVLHSINSANTTALRDDVNITKKGLDDLIIDRESGRTELQADLGDAREESRVLTERINHLETMLGPDSR